MNCLCLHGNLGQKEDYDFIQEVDGIVPIDLWDYSSLTFEETTARIYGDHFLENQINGLVGYSLGGRLALSILCQFPDQFDFAVIISANPGLKDRSKKDQRLERDIGWAKMIRRDPWTDFVKAWNSQIVLADTGPNNHGTQHEFRKDAIAAGFENWSLGHQPDLRAELALLKTKVTWVVGENDPKFVAIARDVISIFQKGELHIIRDCGHRVLFDQPEKARQIIESAMEA